MTTETPHILPKTNLHELHWRKEPPKWKGNIDQAYKKYYPHMVDEVYCRQCGAIPCPLDHDEEKNIRLRDLEFVRELAKERKELIAKHDKVR